jgi:hypothetical protein
VSKQLVSIKSRREIVMDMNGILKLPLGGDKMTRLMMALKNAS